MTRRKCWCAAVVVAVCYATAAAAASGQSGTVIARARTVSQHLRAYGQVQPVAITEVHAIEPGEVTRLVLPGEQVKAGQVLAVLSGPQAEAVLAQRRGALHAASMQLAADRRKLTGRLVTRQEVAADEAAYDSARGQLNVVLQTLTLRAAAAGQVLSVAAADGEQVASGQLILAVQTGRPWLKAIFYGADALAIHSGMTGRFQPVSGGAVPVRVSTVAAVSGPDGGEQVGLFPVDSRVRAAAATGSWRSGEWGTVILRGATRSMVAVPTRALILDRAHWWVLVRTARGDRRQRVVPGPSRGWMTLIAHGLEPGERVVAQNAYLEFYRGIASQYTPPD